jgi:glycogen synthase
VLAAAQAGCALVLSDIPTFRELWDEAAIFVDPHDAGDIARACDALMADPAERAAWGRRARTRAELYSVDAMCDATLALYRSLAARSAVQQHEVAA